MSILSKLNKGYKRFNDTIVSKGGVGPTLYNMADKGGDKLGDAMMWTGGKMAKSAVSKDPDGQTFWNAYTGLRESPLLVASAWGAAGIYGASKISMTQTGKESKMGEQSYSGSAPFIYDPGRSNAPTLGASGDLVLGLNSARRR